MVFQGDGDYDFVDHQDGDHDDGVHDEVDQDYGGGESEGSSGMREITIGDSLYRD